ncbi:hypothetical protein MSIBF_A2870005 [groundwater metagenome]|uniref:Uncharacterized protein n=1 Tax=groundwater metagenome TaxID=717931 RepID=A0A098EA59_9ZZZZ
MKAEKEPENVKIVNDCFSNVIDTKQGYPQFGCAANGKSKVGEFMSIEDMQKFADECKESAKK